MLIPVYAPKFKKDYKRLGRAGKDTSQLDEVLSMIIHEEALPHNLSDHALHGKLSGYRDCHISDDWVVMYKIAGDRVIFARTGSHSDLFD